jgi:hypothetical protein
MASPIIISTAVASLLGFLLNSAGLYLVISNARRRFHYLFAGILLTCAIWDLGIFLSMIRNSHLDELIAYGYFALTPAYFIPALVHQFSFDYVGKRYKWSVYLIWAVCAAMILMVLEGTYAGFEGTFSYSWGNIFKPKQNIALFVIIFILWLASMLSSVWILYRGRRVAVSALARRHYSYIIAGFLAITIAVVKALITMGIDIPIVLPMGMVLNDIFAALIGIAIVKERLFDITVIIKKSALYSLLAGFIIFLFSFSEHIFATYLGHLVGEHSEWLHFISIAIVIAVLMPVKHRLESFLDKAFAQRKLEF